MNPFLIQRGQTLLIRRRHDAVGTTYRTLSTVIFDPLTGEPLLRVQAVRATPSGRPQPTQRILVDDIVSVEPR